MLWLRTHENGWACMVAGQPGQMRRSLGPKKSRAGAMNTPRPFVLLVGDDPQSGAPDSRQPTYPMKTTRIAFLVPAITFAMLPPQSLTAQDKPTPAVEALLKKIDSMCGQPAGKARSLTITGTYAIRFEGAATDTPVAQGTYKEHYVGDHLARHKSDMGEHGALERGVAKNLVWEVDPAMGAKVHLAVHAGAVRRHFAIMAGRSPRSMYQKFEQVDTEHVDGSKHTVLRMTPKVGKPDTWFVTSDGRVSRIDTALPSPESSGAGTGLDDMMAATILFDDWRKVGDAMLPHARKMKMGPAIVSYTCKKIATGGKIPDATFVPPTAIGKLDRTAAAPAFGADGKPNYQVVERKPQHVASIRVKCKPSEVAQQLATLLPEVMTQVSASGAQIAGAPFSRYHKMGKDVMELEAGVPVKKPFEERGRVKNSKLPGGKVASCWHVGPYHQLGSAHAGLTAYIVKNQLEANGGPWEIYWTDPGMVKDTSKWRTQLFAPLK